MIRTAEGGDTFGPLNAGFKFLDALADFLCRALSLAQASWTGSVLLVPRYVEGFCAFCQSHAGRSCKSHHIQASSPQVRFQHPLLCA